MNDDIRATGVALIDAEIEMSDAGSTLYGMRMELNELMGKEHRTR